MLRGLHTANSLDLDPFQLRLVGLGAVSRALRDICQDGPIRVWPRSRPLELNLAAGRDRRRERPRRRVDVTVDVLCAVVVGCNEAAVKVLSVPRSNIGDFLAILLGVVVVQDESLVLYSICLKCCHHAMTEHGGGKAAHQEGN